MQFLKEADKVKSVFRRNRILHDERAENDAEHSWHLALMAVVLSEHASPKVDVLHVVKMLLIHDLVEIDAGDTFAFDQAAVLTQREREERAAERIFGLLPADMAEEMRAVWEEFECQETPEARFAGALDCLGGGVVPKLSSSRRVLARSGGDSRARQGAEQRDCGRRTHSVGVCGRSDR